MNSKRGIDPKVYAFAALLAEDLPAVLHAHRSVWVDRLADRLQQAFEDWAEDADTAAAVKATADHED